MTNPVTASKAKTELLNLLNRVEAGQTITITRHGRPVAELGPVSGKPLDVQPTENDDAMPTGVLRPAPGAAAAFPDANPPARIAALEHKKTAPEPVLDRSPVSKAPPLTLADIIRAGGGQS